ncbi:MAG: cytochrome-c oxidase [Gammaproteobacteria bacterium]
MNPTGLFIALGGAIIVWVFLVRRLRTKPWIEKGPIELEDGASGVPAERVGLWIFLAVVTSLFSIFIVLYSERSTYPDWRPLPTPQLLWINTIFLVLGSFAFQRARGAAKREDLAGVKVNLTAGGLSTIVFLVGQVIAWRQLSASGYFLATNPANTFFYVITGLHGLHLLGGLWVWARTTSRVWHGLESLDVTQIAAVRLSVQLCSVYSHYLLLLWLVLFYMLSST